MTTALGLVVSITACAKENKASRLPLTGMISFSTSSAGMLKRRAAQLEMASLSANVPLVVG